MNSDTAPLLRRVPLGAALSDPGAILDRFLDWVNETGIAPYPAQEEALLELMDGHHVVLNTPTGSGKSLVALGLHFKAMCEGRRSFYTAPVKALVSEKFFNLCELFGASQVGMLTGDASINWAAPIICCTAEVLSNMAIRQGERADAPYVVMDEFHYYGDPERGVAWQVPLLILPGTTFLLMSATLGNTAAIEERLRADTGRTVSHVFSDDRPVPLDYAYRETSLHETVEELCAEGRSPVYVVSFTQRDCAEFAQALTSAKLLDRDAKRELTAELSDFSFDSPYGKSIRRFLSHGVGLHHAGLLPKYRLLVEQLSQRGLLRVICGTDTLGVGVNIPIRTVVFSKLSKFDGEKLRLLNAREFHQISGRAGRKGFDDRGSVVCQAPEHVVENKRARGKPGAARRPKKRAPRDQVPWNEQQFEQLIARPPETMRSQFRVNHGILVSALQRDPEITGPRGAYADLIDLIGRSHESEAGKKRLRREAAQLFRALRGAEIVRLERSARGVHVVVDADLQREFSLHHTLSLFLVEALEILDRGDSAYAFDLLSLMESILENPRAILYAQERKAKSDLVAKLKAKRVPYEERMRRLESVTYPKPNAKEIYAAWNLFAEHHPWVGQENIRPKSIAREMAERFYRFEDYVKLYRIERVEGLLLRYISDAYGTLLRTVPDAAKTEDVLDILAYLRDLIARVDSSLLEAWESRLTGAVSTDVKETESARKPPAPPSLREIRARVRAELHALVRALAEENYEEAATLLRPGEDAWTAAEIEEALDPFFDRYERLRSDGEARRADRTVVKPVDAQHWNVVQVLCDPEDDNTWFLEGEVDLTVDGPGITLRRIGQ